MQKSQSVDTFLAHRKYDPGVFYSMSLEEDDMIDLNNNIINDQRVQVETTYDVELWNKQVSNYTFLKEYNQKVIMFYFLFFYLNN